MIHAGEPQRPLAAHAVPARERVDLRVLEHVADVDVSGHVRRRNDDRKYRPRTTRISAKELLVYPSLGPARLNQPRFVNFGEFGGSGRPFGSFSWWPGCCSFCCPFGCPFF